MKKNELVNAHAQIINEKTAIGLGSRSSPINFYIANRSLIDNHPALNELRGLAIGELT